jgi:hypothetical protein
MTDDIEKNVKAYSILKEIVKRRAEILEQRL